MNGLALTMRLIWRRNRVYWLAWILFLAITPPLTAAKYRDLIPPGQHGDLMLAALAANPTMRAILGVPFDLHSAGGFTIWRVGGFTAAAAAMMAALGVVRATRAEEEAGRVELLRSTAVGRHVPLAAGILVALAGCTLLGAAITVLMVVGNTPWQGSLAMGTGIGLTGAVFAGLGAVSAQVFSSARAAKAWALGAGLGGLYLLRALIDAGGDGNPLEPLRWAIPLSWAQLARPYAQERWWVLLLPVAVTAILTVLAFRLESVRDHGAGLRGAAIGRAQAPRGLSGAWGLARRLHRGQLIGWTVAMVVSALMMGSLSRSIQSMTEGNDQVAQMLRAMGGGGVLRDAFYAAMLGIMATLLGVFSAMLLNALRTEEDAGHAEQMLSTATPRHRFLSSHAVWAVLGPSALLLAVGALIPVSEAIQTGEPGLIWTQIRAALVLLPGLWLVAGLAVALIGWLPRAYPGVWVLLTWTIFCSWIAALFDLPKWLISLHPWGHLPRIPTDAMTWTPVLITTAAALMLGLLGLYGYRRRDVTGP